MPERELGEIFARLNACEHRSRNDRQAQSRRNMLPLNAEVGGPLNPRWVEWLMGWPTEHTSCDVSETDRFQRWQQWRSQF